MLQIATENVGLATKVKVFGDSCATFRLLIDNCFT